jgi:hypothetical protein
LGSGIFWEFAPDGVEDPSEALTAVPPKMPFIKSEKAPAWAPWGYKETARVVKAITMSDVRVKLRMGRQEKRKESLTSCFDEIS